MLRHFLVTAAFIIAIIIDCKMEYMVIYMNETKYYGWFGNLGILLKLIHIMLNTNIAEMKFIFLHW